MWGNITDELFLQGEDNNRGDHILYLGQNFGRGLDCGDDRPNRLCDVHSSDLLVFTTIKLERVAEFGLGGFPALRSDLRS